MIRKNEKQNKNKELIEKVSCSQVKINELSFLNKQLTQEIERIRTDYEETIQKMQENFNQLKNKYTDIDNQLKSKVGKSQEVLKKCYVLLTTNERLYGQKAQTTEASIMK